MSVAFDAAASLFSSVTRVAVIIAGPTIRMRIPSSVVAAPLAAWIEI